MPWSRVYECGSWIDVGFVTIFVQNCWPGVALLDLSRCVQRVGLPLGRDPPGDASAHGLRSLAKLVKDHNRRGDGGPKNGLKKGGRA